MSIATVDVDSVRWASHTSASVVHDSGKLVSVACEPL